MAGYGRGVAFGNTKRTLADHVHDFDAHNERSSAATYFEPSKVGNKGKSAI